MPGMVKYGSNGLAQFLDAPDPVYGTGDDGSVTMDGTTTVLSMAPSASVYSMTRDIYCYNLTINDSVRLAPNGYRIFVKNILTLGNGAIIGWPSGTGYATNGSIQQGGAAATSVTHSLGGSGTGTGAGTATAPTAALGGTAYYKQPLQAIRGWASTASGTAWLRGGAGGPTSGGGPGGGVIICAARYIACTATSTNAKFSATGGATGGGGGVILIVSSAAALPSNVSTDVTGNGGAASGTYNYMQVL